MPQPFQQVKTKKIFSPVCVRAGENIFLQVGLCPSLDMLKRL